MPARALLLASAAAVLGTLAVSEAPSDLRLIANAAIVAIGLTAIADRRPALPLALLVIVVAAAFNAQWRERHEKSIAEGRTARYHATLLESSEGGDDSAAVTLALDGGARVVARVRQSPPPVGSAVSVRGRVEPFDEARNPGEPSERDIERERGLDGRLDGATILASNSRFEPGAQTWLARAHAWAHAELRNRLGEPSASVVAGELWGERSTLPPALRTEFQETGTVHVLVTAGLHLGAVAALSLAILTLFAMPRWTTCLCAIAVVWLFVWWSGAQLPAVRAATMATAALTARAFGRATLSWNALAAAGLVLTFARPSSVATASFALSFSCVGAIFTFAKPFEHWVERAVALPDRVREAIVLSVATQIGVWPLGAAVFLQFTPYAVLANVAVVPCVALTMALGAAQLASSWCSPLAQAFANANSWLLAWMLAVVSTLGALPGAAIAMTPPPAWCVCAYDAALLAAPVLWRKGVPGIGLALAAAATALVLWPPRHSEHRLHVTVLDVGQADAIVIQTPRGHVLLVDAGGRLERGAQSSGSAAEAVGERVVVPFLLRHGIHALDALIVSHPHGDHVGGAAPVLRRLRVARLADSGQRYGGHAYLDALATARGQSVPIVTPRAGLQWVTDDGIALHFLGPSLPLISNSRNDINENSIAFTLRYESFCMLFTGDAGAAAEQRFLNEDADLRCEVLKVGHHGSAYGSTPQFIEAVRPRYAIISVGRHNLFGHPAPATLATLQRFGAKIFRTDENGAITVLSDGRVTTLSRTLPLTKN